MAADKSPFERLKGAGDAAAGSSQPAVARTAELPVEPDAAVQRVERVYRNTHGLLPEFAALGVLVPILAAIASHPGSSAPIEQRKDALKQITEVSRRVAHDAFQALADCGPIEKGAKVRLQAMAVQVAAGMLAEDGAVDERRLGETFRDAIARLSADLQACCHDFAETAGAEILRDAAERQDLLVASSRVVFLLSGELLDCEASQVRARIEHVDQLSRKIFAETQDSPLYARLERGARFAHACELSERLSQLVIAEYQHSAAAGPIGAPEIDALFRRAQGNYRHIERIAIDIVERYAETEAGERHESMA